MTCAAPATAAATGGQEEAGKSGTRRRSPVRTTIVGRDDFNVLDAAASVTIVVFNPDIRKMHLVVVVRQVVLTRPLLDFLILALGSTISVRLVAISLLQECLILAFQLVVENDTM